jgi:hypothetical protein
MSLDVTYRVQIPHRAGQLAAVASMIAEHQGLIGDVVTVNLGREATIREITIEVADTSAAWDLASDLNKLPGVKVLWHHDRAFIRHDGGKLQISARHPVTTVQEMRDIYTPGVARICTAIAENPNLAGRYTMIGQTVAIVTNGSRVLGLGDIGPVASMPVMEGKAVFYDQCAGLNAMPILLDAHDPDTFVEAVARIAPTFGAIHLEDISAPDCFEIEARLIEALPQPVMHDDVHGTAVVTLAAAIAGCRQVDLRLDQSVVGQLGLGAAGFGIAALVKDGGAERVLAFDPDERMHARARGSGDPGAHQPGAGDLPRRRARRGRRVRSRWVGGQQRARLPGDLPRRADGRGEPDHHGDEARGRVGARGPDDRVRARPGPAGPPRPRRGRRGRPRDRGSSRPRRPGAGRARSAGAYDIAIVSCVRRKLLPDGSRKPQSIPYGRCSGSSTNSTPRPFSDS